MNFQEFIPYGRQTITTKDIQAVQDVLRSPYLTQGPCVPAFEKLLASQVNVKYSIAVNSATSALHLACLALEIGPGDCIWTSPITFVASANCARYCGADVRFIDIEPNTGLLDPNVLERELYIAASNGTLPKAILPVHLAGTSCAMSKISSLAKSFNVAVLEDASHAIGASYNGNPVGSCEYSDISVFSFHPVKIITTGEGGAATTNNPSLAERMSILRSHGIERDTTQFEYPPAGPWSYEQQHLGYNYRLTDIQAALGISQLDRLHEIVVERNRLFNNYHLLLKDLPVRLLDIPQDCTSSLHLAVIRLLSSDAAKHLRVFQGLRDQGIGVQLHYSPVHLQPYYRRRGCKPGDCPEAEAYATSAISLPLYPGLTASDQSRVVEVLHSLL